MHTSAGRPDHEYGRNTSLVSVVHIHHGGGRLSPKDRISTGGVAPPSKRASRNAAGNDGGPASMLSGSKAGSQTIAGLSRSTSSSPASGQILSRAWKPGSLDRVM